MTVFRDAALPTAPGRVRKVLDAIVCFRFAATTEVVALGLVLEEVVASDRVCFIATTGVVGLSLVLEVVGRWSRSYRDLTLLSLTLDLTAVPRMSGTRSAGEMTFEKVASCIVTDLPRRISICSDYSEIVWVGLP